MQRIKVVLEDKMKNHPWWAMTIVAFFVATVVLFMPSDRAPRSAIPGFKEGFIMVLSTSKLVDPAADLQLRGTKVQLLHQESDGTPPCRILHPPLAFSANERSMTLAGTLDEIEATVLSVSADDLKHIALSLPSNTSIAPCINSVKIVYGQEG